MLLTDMQMLMRQCRWGCGKSSKALAEEHGITAKALDGVLHCKRKGISRRMIELFDLLGYDLEVRVLPKGSTQDNSLRRYGHIDSFRLMRNESKTREEQLSETAGISPGGSILWYLKHTAFSLARYLRCADVMGYSVLICKKGRPLNESVVVVDQKIFDAGRKG